MTDFYCCDKLKDDLTDPENIHIFTVHETMEILDIEYCPYCGHKLSTL